MTIALWIINIVLAVAFLAAGVMKLVRPPSALVRSGMAWAGDMPAAQVKAVGAVEVLGALGVVLPFVTRIAPVLSPLAATGLLLVMIGAIVVHLRRHENPLPPIVSGVIALAGAVLGFAALAA